MPTADPYLPSHGDPSWGAVHYDLDLDYDLLGARLDGVAKIQIRAHEELAKISLDLAYLSVKKVTVDGKPPAKWTHTKHRLVLTLRTRIKAGKTAEILVKYSGKPRPLVIDPHGDAGWEELADGIIVAGQPHGAPTWFPCNDWCGDKATYRISVRADENYSVVSNGVLTSRTRRGSGEVWVYDQRQPMATYLATVQLGRYVPHPIEADVPMAVFAEAGSDVASAFADQGRMLAYFTEVFGPYPFDTYSTVVTPDELEIPLESQSLATFGSNFLTSDWKHVRLVAHELAHQWFGNAVTMRTMQHIWLHEGFACYAEWLWSEAIGRDRADWHAKHHYERLAALPQDLLLADPGPELMFDDRVYKRGALTLHALRTAVGDEAFFTILRTWVERFGGLTVVSEDFEALAAEVSGQDLSGLFGGWLHSTALPAFGG